MFVAQGIGHMKKIRVRVVFSGLGALVFFDTCKKKVTHSLALIGPILFKLSSSADRQAGASIREDDEAGRSQK